MWLVATNHHIEQYIHKPLVRPQKVLLDSYYLEAKTTSSKCKVNNKMRKTGSKLCTQVKSTL